MGDAHIPYGIFRADTRKEGMYILRTVMRCILQYGVQYSSCIQFVVLYSSTRNRTLSTCGSQQDLKAATRRNDELRARCTFDSERSECGRRHRHCMYAKYPAQQFPHTATLVRTTDLGYVIVRTRHTINGHQWAANMSEVAKRVETRATKKVGSVLSTLAY